MKVRHKFAVGPPGVEFRRLMARLLRTPYTDQEADRRGSDEGGGRSTEDSLVDDGEVSPSKSLAPIAAEDGA